MSLETTSPTLGRGCPQAAGKVKGVGRNVLSGGKLRHIQALWLGSRLLPELQVFGSSVGGSCGFPCGK